MSVITATAWVTYGLSFYGGDFIGQRMACGDYYTETLGNWAAVPVEWVLGGYVDCEDTLCAEFSTGKVICVPIEDTGCHLHHPVWDTGQPMGADFPVYERWGEPTATGKIAVVHQDGTVWDPPPSAAWCIEYCRGPLTWEPPLIEPYPY